MWAPRPEDLRANFAEADLRRGRRYACEGHVLWRELREQGQERTLIGEVRGSRRRPWRVLLRAWPRAERWRIESHCSCPVQVACKHAVALLLADLAGAGEAPPAPSDRHASALQPQEGRIGWLGASLGEQRVLGLRPGRWLAATGGGWRFEALNVTQLRNARLPAQDEASAALLAVVERTRPLWFEGTHWWLPGAALFDALLALAREGMCAWQRPGLLLAEGAPRALDWRWRIDGRGCQTLHIAAGGGQCLRMGDRWFYVDPLARELGTLPDSPEATLMAELVALPSLPAEAVAGFVDSYARRLPPGFPLPRELVVEAPCVLAPIPILTLHQSASAEESRGRRLAHLIAFARLSFRYGPTRVGEADPITEPSVYDGERVRRYPRDRGRERELATRLKQLGLISNRHAMIDHPGLQQNDWLINPDGDPQTLNEFCYAMLPRLRAQGWRLEYGPRFPLKLVDADYRFYGEVQAEEAGGLAIELGIEVDGERINLLPVLREGLREGRFNELPSATDAIVALTLPGERRLPIAAGRLRFILDTLNELAQSGAADQRRLQLPRARAAALVELEGELGAGRRLWPGSGAVRELADQLARYAGLPATPVPSGLRATLRPYQVEGQSWLRFLGAAGLAGILADDMGLGKTVQVLAWIVGEHEAGRLDRPALVVCPKSVLPNWAAEIARFAPQLRVMLHAGPERGRRRRGIADADLVLTTYPVLARDVEALAAQSWHLVALDESQMVKNPTTLAARAARRLNARLRVCLTGTPLENHLGELWAQFDFLLPGLLGSKADFTRHFRKPIEKGRDRDARERLRRRIRPFLMRRTKDQVAADLPEKTEVARAIALEGRQRDLYDTLAAACAEELRGYIAAQSFERNRMRVLEGLMRLRQVCCDPRLVAPERARAANSAKLDYLMDMLHELIAAGRRILVFSQFTSMLELIEAELAAERIRYVKLTGQTEDRAAPVQRFQRGEVPVFLISLRAGGFGLNLTRADTVIHYDPWWNPAVESQATDRAHRIGQDKPVFVYRLIAAQTIEERILALQARKRELADALFDESGQSLASLLAPEDWLALLEG
ncbi:MAG: DEAD/DEAH box helicase [Xanthomonadales bacterium]|nr:DEAD/DEAH box helicase [Xanthomonadales bacterium]